MKQKKPLAAIKDDELFQVISLCVGPIYTGDGNTIRDYVNEVKRRYNRLVRISKVLDKGDDTCVS
jgi:hypothetical protein